MKRLCLYDVKNSIIQMISERNDLEFDRFKTAVEKVVCSGKSSAFHK